MLLVNCLPLITGGYFSFILQTAECHCWRIWGWSFTIQSEFKMIFITCYYKVINTFGSVLRAQRSPLWGAMPKILRYLCKHNYSRKFVCIRIVQFSLKNLLVVDFRCKGKLQNPKSTHTGWLQIIALVVWSKERFNLLTVLNVLESTVRRIS